jgi:DNA repair exonuclease SbcCD ATPase subunit
MYQLPASQQQILIADLQQLQQNSIAQDNNYQQVKQSLKTSNEQIAILTSKLATAQQLLTNSNNQIATLKVQLTAAQQSTIQAQQSLTEISKSWKAYQKSVSDKHFGLGIGGGVINSKAVALASLEYDNHNLGYEIIGGQSSVIGLIKYRF